jgi:hypothetical protein
MAPVTLKNGFDRCSVAASALAKPVTLPIIIIMPIIRSCGVVDYKSSLKHSC